MPLAGLCLVQEQKQLERQQHMQEQRRVDAVQSDVGVNTTVNSNATDHMDDFVARIDKLRQVTCCALCAR